MQSPQNGRSRRGLGAGVALLAGCCLVCLGALLWGPPAHAHPVPAPARPATSNRIAQENALPGTDTWGNIGNYDLAAFSAFAGATSVNAGNPIDIHVTSPGGTSLSATLYRMGYYQGHGARQYPLNPSSFPISTHLPGDSCPRDMTTGLVQCAWSSFSLATDPSWISGIYLLCMDTNNGNRFFVYFTVRNDSYPADIVVSESSKTNQAYNTFGGESLYFSAGPTPTPTPGAGPAASNLEDSDNDEPGEILSPSSPLARTRAYMVSFDRPYRTGAGTGSLFTHDMDMVRWLEASGYDVTYISDIDRVANPTFYAGHRVYIDVGHDEYWSWAERDNVEAALAANVNIVFASGNESYWNVRLQDSGVGTGPNRIIVCYKDETLDPTATPPAVTVAFHDPILNRPENSLVGVGYESWYDDVAYNAPWVLSAPPNRWYFDCTGFQAGDRVNNVVGEEWMGLYNNGRTPAGIEVLSNGSIIANDGLPYPQNSTIYTTTYGTRVFAAGSIHWSWGLIDHSSRPTAVPTPGFATSYLSNDADHRIEQLTANVIDNFAGYWDGQSRGDCANQPPFYDIGARATRTARPMPPTATGTPPTATRTATATRTSTATPTSTRIPTGTPTPVPRLLTGHLTWQGRPSQPNPLQALPLTLTLTVSGTPYTWANLTTDAAGAFTVTVTTLPTGTYGWRAKGPQFLATAGSVVLAGSPSTALDAGLQSAGDVNGDNLVDVTDFTVLRAAFGTGCGGPGFDARADLNGDCVIDVLDFTLLRANFGQGGP
jgi:hypothetical protein